MVIPLPGASPTPHLERPVRPVRPVRLLTTTLLPYSHLAPVQKYLTRSIRAINSNTETVKSYHCCLLPVACCLPSQVSFRLGARSE
ncbi:MAG: hypothetical protein F6K31_27465 [Symploca sp. SIO2G7]|nr:hypothetical protein [Symploca sp. SIO2G7]